MKLRVKFIVNKNGLIYSSNNIDKKRWSWRVISNNPKSFRNLKEALEYMRNT